MPSPFPGMDPYLESPDFWHNVHKHLIVSIYATLNRDLPEGFAAHLEETVYVARPDYFAPDVAVYNHFAVASNRPPHEEGGVAVAIKAPIHIEVPQIELHLPYIEIVTARGNHEVVTAIEVLSPVNKRGEGREKYLRKQRKILKSQTNLIEIDLLRSGVHTCAVPRIELEKVTHWDYLICLHKAGQSGFECWPFTVRDEISPLVIPLNEGDSPLEINLQALFDGVYDSGPFRREVDYKENPEPKLKAVDAVWADVLLRDKGLR
jgi:hypothetical protein